MKDDPHILIDHQGLSKHIESGKRMEKIQGHVQEKIQSQIHLQIQAQIHHLTHSLLYAQIHALIHPQVHHQLEHKLSIKQIPRNRYFGTNSQEAPLLLHFHFLHTYPLWNSAITTDNDTNSLA